jgi:hypothetical protein
MWKTPIITVVPQSSTMIHRCQTKVIVPLCRGTGTANPSRLHVFTSDFSVIRGAPSLVLCVRFCRSLFVICHFSFGHSVDCPSIHEYWLPLWYLQSRIPFSKFFSIFRKPLENQDQTSRGQSLTDLFRKLWRCKYLNTKSKSNCSLPVVKSKLHTVELMAYYYQVVENS